MIETPFAGSNYVVTCAKLTCYIRQPVDINTESRCTEHFCRVRSFLALVVDQ